MSEDSGLKVKGQIDEVKMGMDTVFEMLIQVQLCQARRMEKAKEG